MLLWISLREKWVVTLGDVSTAFLHAPLGPDAKVYIRPPQNLRKPVVLWKLHKALYGLRESPRLFQEYMAKKLSEHGFIRSIADRGPAAVLPERW